MIIFIIVLKIFGFFSNSSILFKLLGYFTLYIFYGVYYVFYTSVGTESEASNTENNYENVFP